MYFINVMYCRYNHADQSTTFLSTKLLMLFSLAKHIFYLATVNRWIGSGDSKFA